ncbi:hypothetical protein RB594_001232 [Gaeumannomyces avenae]
MSDKGTSDHVSRPLDGAAAGSGKKRGCGAHMKRKWWAYLLGLIVLIVILVPVLILVAVPKIAQKKIDEAQLEIRAFSALNTQSDNFTLRIDSVIRTDGSVHATIAGFEGVMYLEDWAPQRPFARVHFPETTSDAYQEVRIEQLTPIDDMDAFTVYNTWLLINETLRVTVRGDTTVRVRGIDRAYPVLFKKTITVPGLRLFEGTVVRDPAISLTGDAQGNNFKGMVDIPNNSQVTFEIGNATFHNYLDGAEIGTVFINNMILRPGNNTFPMNAKVDNGPVLTFMSTRPACETGSVPFQLRGKDVVNNGQRLSYFADSLASANQTVNIDIGGALKHRNVTIACRS